MNMYQIYEPKYFFNIIYIAGKGHSGSTALDLLLGASPNIMSVGEFRYGVSRFTNKCGCGETLETCPFWKKVRERFNNHRFIKGIYNWDDLIKYTQKYAGFRLILQIMECCRRTRWNSP